MLAGRTASEILEADFLAIRHELLNVAAGLDRVDRGQASSVMRDDARWLKLSAALSILGDGAQNRAERIQMVFSRPYDATWRERSDPGATDR